MSTHDPYAEFATRAERSAQMAYGDIATRTGLSVERVTEIGNSNNLGVLFGDDGRLRTPTELRAMTQAGALAVSSPQRRRSVQEKMLDLMAMRWPATQTPTQRLTQLRDMALEFELSPAQRDIVRRQAELEAMRPENRNKAKG